MTDAISSPQLAAAIAYAARGWLVIPLHSPRANGCSCGRADCGRSTGKHPRLDDWRVKASTDAAVIRGWWRTWPDANVGLVTGRASGFAVLDVDGERGEQSLAELERKHGPLPATMTVRTGSGGRHLLFLHPGFELRNSQGRLGPGLDVRGDGGQVVAPPSLHRSGSSYAWLAGPGELAPVPAWLLELLKPAQTPAPCAPLLPDRSYERARRYLSCMDPSISGSGGHDSCWSAAVAMVRGFRLSEGEALQLLLAEFNPRCSPPWSEKEVLHKIRDASSNATIPFGYLLDAERHQRPELRPAASNATSATTRGYSPAASPAASASREPGEDDGDDGRSAPGAELQQAPASQPTRLGLQPVSVLLAEAIPPTDWVLNPWLEASTLAALVAAPNIGKTLLAFWMATQVAAAGERVAIIEEEGSKRGFQKRLDRAVRAVGSEHCASIDWTFKPRLNLLSRADVKALCAELVGYRLVIIDSFARVTTGVEENDAKEMGQLVEVLDHIREATQACILLIHHTNKARWKPGEVPTLSDGRGSSALSAGLDTMLNLASVEDKEPGVVQFDLHVTKQRDEERVDAQRVRVTMTGPEATVSLDGERVVERGKKPSATDQRVAGIMHLVMNAIPSPPEAPVSRSDLQDKVGKRKADVLAAVGRLVDQGKVRELSKNRIIRVPSPNGAAGERIGERAE